MIEAVVTVVECVDCRDA
jgi:hypothetical protein